MTSRRWLDTGCRHPLGNFSATTVVSPSNVTSKPSVIEYIEREKITETTSLWRHFLSASFNYTYSFKLFEYTISTRVLTVFFVTRSVYTTRVATIQNNGVCTNCKREHSYRFFYNPTLGSDSQSARTSCPDMRNRTRFAKIDFNKPQLFGSVLNKIPTRLSPEISKKVLVASFSNFHWFLFMWIRGCTLCPILSQIKKKMLKEKHCQPSNVFLYILRYILKIFK